MATTSIDIFTDGSGASERVPHVAGWAFVAFGGDRNNIIYRSCGKCAGDGLEAEAWAVVHALRWAKTTMPGARLLLWCDNTAVVGWMVSQLEAKESYWTALNEAMCGLILVPIQITAENYKGDIRRLHKICHQMANKARKSSVDKYLASLSKTERREIKKLYKKDPAAVTSVKLTDIYRPFKPRNLWFA